MRKAVYSNSDIQPTRYTIRVLQHRGLDSSDTAVAVDVCN